MDESNENDVDRSQVSCVLAFISFITNSLIFIFLSHSSPSNQINSITIILHTKETKRFESERTHNLKQIDGNEMNEEETTQEMKMKMKMCVDSNDANM